MEKKRRSPRLQHMRITNELWKMQRDLFTAHHPLTVRWGKIRVANRVVPPLSELPSFLLPNETLYRRILYEVEGFADDRIFETLKFRKIKYCIRR